MNFALILASRAAEQEQSEARRESQQNGAAAIQQLAGNGAQNLSLLSALAADTETQASGTDAAGGAALPSSAGNSDFGGDSVAISGQSGTVSPLAGLDMDQLRDAIETARAQGALGGQGVAADCSAAGDSAEAVLAAGDLAEAALGVVAAGAEDSAADVATSAASIPASRTAHLLDRQQLGSQRRAVCAALASRSSSRPRGPTASASPS